jgi:hypothetical protein
MADSDFYLDAARQQLAQLDAEKAAALADLAAHRANGDRESAACCVQTLANLEAQRQNLTALANQYVASQHPPAQPELSAEERAARPWDRMTPDDGLQIAKTSKYGKNIDWNDPYVRAGYVEAQRRRARGE